MIRWLGLTALPAVLLSACYSYQTVNIAEVPVGASVRARLTPDEAARLGEILGTESRVFEGELLSRPDSATVVLRIPTLAAEHSAATSVNYQNISVAMQAVQDAEIRRFNRGRTTTVLAIGGVALASVITAALVAQEQPVGGPGKGGSNAFRPAAVPRR